MNRTIRRSKFGLAVAFGLLSHSALSCLEENVRYSQSNNRIYIEDGAACSPSQIDVHVVNRYSSVVPNQVMEQLSPNTWLLKAELHIADGSTLNLIGTDEGGDTDAFYMLSENGASPYHVKIQAKTGNVMIKSTLVSSWDPAVSGPDTDYENGRAFIHVNSLEIDGVAHESRMDVLDSEVSYLGFLDSESYGLVWKVRGGKNNHDIYDRVEVYGDIQNSYIHHNYMGHYSFGSLDQVLHNNEIAYNISYGLDPHDDSDRVIITDNDVHDNGNHGIICSRRCNDLIITGNVSYRNRHGIMLHRDTNYTLVENNTVYDNRDNGIAVFESHYNIIRNNTMTGNKHGIRLSLGSHDNLIQSNVMENNLDNGLYQYGGSDAPETTNGRPSENTFESNTVRNNGRLIKLRESDNIVMRNNIFEGDTDIEIYDSTNIQILDNNHFFGEMAIRLDGVGLGDGDATVEVYDDVKIKISDFVELNLINEEGRILDPEENSGEVVVAETSKDGVPTFVSTTKVEYADVGAKTEVDALDFWVEPAGGEIVMDAISFGSDAKTWTTVASVNEPSVTYKVGGLVSGVDYSVLKDGSEIAVIEASSSQIQFTDTATSSEADYAVVVDGQAIGITPSGDSYVRDGFPDTNYGTATTLEAKFSGTPYMREAYMQFDISGYGSQVESAVITVTAALSSAGLSTTDVFSTSTGWDESTVTWNTKPAVDEMLGSFTIDTNVFGTYSVDVTDYINDLIDAGESVASFGFLNPAKTKPITRIRSRERASEAPKLYVTQ